MRTVKILAGVVGGILVLAVAAIVAVGWLVNPNDYQDRIAAAVKEATGRDLTLKGNLKLSVFPWVALDLGPASLSNPPGFGAQPFLAFEHAAVRVSLWPLLQRRLEINRLEVDGLDVRLLKNAQGVGNWENFGRTPRSASAGGDGAAGAAPPPLSGIRITHGRVSYPGVTLQNLTLAVGAFGVPGATPINMTFDANRGVPDETLSVNAKFDLGQDAPGKPWQLAAVNLSGLLARPGDARPAHWEFTAPMVTMNPTTQTLGAPAFALSYSGAHLTGMFQAARIFDDLNAAGSVTLAPLVLREFAPRLGLTLPKTRDPRALAQLSVSTDFSYAAEGVRLSQLQAQLDDTHVKGSIAYVGEPRAFKFQLAVDTIDADRYLSADAGSAGAAPDKASGALGRSPEAQAATAAEAPKGADADGTLTLGAVHFSPLDFSTVRVTVASKDGVVHLFPAVAQIDGGTYSGNITLDRQAAIPALSIDEHLISVDMTRLLASTACKGKLSGRGNVNLKATARGGTLAEFLQSLNGQFEANIAGGALEGIDLAYEYGVAQALLKHTEAPAPSNPRQTKFDAAHLSADINNGVAKTSDLTVATSVLKVTGQGSANLNNQAIDFKVLASVLQGGSSVADIPLKVTGTYADPKVRADVESLAKGQLKQKLQDVLKKNGLQGLFGK